VQIPFEVKHCDIRAPENEYWYRKYRYDIPVLHVNGQFAMQHRVDEVKLEKILRTAGEVESISKPDE
jgi:hypothetical protein